MFVLLIGDTNGGRNAFYEYVCTRARKDIVWLNNIRTSLETLVVHFGGPDRVEGIKTITWSGDHQETLERVYKNIHKE